MLSAKEKKKIFEQVEKIDPHFIDSVVPFLEGLYRYYFRCDVEGWDNIPDEKVLFVCNHNGLITFETIMLFYAWWKEMGNKKETRRVLGLAHDIVFKNPAFNWLCPRVGAIPADPDTAYEAFKRDFSVLVFPGGLKEAFRPYAERAKVDFYQRKGFIRLALKGKVPIVPIVSVGAAESYFILHRGEEIAEALGIKEKFRIHGVPITARSLFFFWCIASGIFTIFPLFLAPWAFSSIFIPLPTKMSFKILPPVDVVGMVDPKLSDEENWQKIYDHVLALMQKASDEGYAQRKLPVLG